VLCCAVRKKSESIAVFKDCVPQQARILSYLGPATVFYLVAWVVSLEGALDAIGLATAVVALLLSLAGYMGNRRSDTAGAQQISLLSTCAGIALVGTVRPQMISLTVEIALVVVLAGFAGLITDLTLSVPDRAWPRMHPKTAQIAPYLIAVVCVACGLFVIAPVQKPFGLPLLLPTRLAMASLVYAAVAVPFALVIRLLRSRLGSSPEALASNNWAVLGLMPASAIVVILGVSRAAHLLESTDSLYRGGVAVVAVCVVLGHVFMIDPRRRLSAGKAVRNAVSATLAMALMAVFVVAFRVHIPEQPWQLVLLLVATLLASAGAYLGFQPIVTRLLAPFGARLLNAIDSAIEQLSEAHSLEEVARAVLVPMRRATGMRDSEPILYAFDPLQEAQIDIAGQPRIASRRLSDAIMQFLRDHPGEIIVRDFYEALIIRQPPLRSLVNALVNLDALCIVPLITKGELEGALVIPKGMRMSTLSLEEIAALRRFSRFLSTFVSVLSAELRAQNRTSESVLASDRAVKELEHVTSELARLRTDVRVLKAGASLDLLKAPVIAYSPAMKGFLKQIDELSRTPNPILLKAESGTSLHAIAYRIHEQSDRKGDAFVIGDCAATNAAQCGTALFGEKEGLGDYPGWLPLTTGGSLFLLDLPAMPREAQRSFAWALGTRQAQRIDGDEPYTVDVKLIASMRGDPQKKGDIERLDSELAKRFSSNIVRVPPLREREDDLSSLVLIELDRASRVLGRPVVGIEPSAMTVLQKHRWPGNEDELRFVIQKAVEKCQTERVREADLPLVSDSTPGILKEDFQLEGTLEVVERRIIEQALATAAGNKSEAARILGLKRTTFLDKLRRYSLE
jgi:DNA-binding NtrC family response regulator